MATRTWSDLSSVQQKVLVAVGSAELALTAYSLRDLRRRAAADVRGPKALWLAGHLVQPVGPLLYLARGRR